MRTQSIEWSEIGTAERHVLLGPARGLPRLLKRAARFFVALVPALAIVVAATFVATLPAQVVYLQAAIWAAGFVFAALAIDAESPEAAILYLATGITLPVLALLSSRVALEFLIVSAALVAAWVAAAILRR
jgi:hypothetical protein